MAIPDSPAETSTGDSVAKYMVNQRLTRFMPTNQFERDRLILMIIGFSPLLLFFVLVWGVPILYAMWMSLLADPIIDPSFTGMTNYVTVVESDIFWKALKNSVVYAVSTTVLTLVLGLASALAVNRLSRGSDYIRTLLILPYLIPVLVVVFLWRFMLGQSLGIVNQIIVSVGLVSSPISFFNSTTWAMPSVVVASLWKWTPFAFFILLSQLQTIDPDLYERARIQGASTWQAFRDITLPNLKGAVMIILLVRGIWMFNKFDIIWLTTGGGPVETTTTLPIRVYRLAFAEVKLGEATALATIMFSILMVFALIYFYKLSPSSEVTE